MVMKGSNFLPLVGSKLLNLPLALNCYLSVITYLVIAFHYLVQYINSIEHLMTKMLNVSICNLIVILTKNFLE